MTDSAPSIAILGAGGLLGSELLRQSLAFQWNVRHARSNDVDGRDEKQVFDWLKRASADALIVCAGYNGGIQTNLASPADLLGENARIAIASIAAARRA